VPDAPIFNSILGVNFEAEGAPLNQPLLRLAPKASVIGAT